MGVFWDLIQQSQISEQRSASQSLEARVAALENGLREVRQVQMRMLEILETHFQQDLDDDGQVGDVRR
jgi:hypothetical protein